MFPNESQSRPLLTSAESWRRRMLRRYLGGVQPVAEPQAVFVAGPAGAGKGLIVDALCHLFANEGFCAVIDTKELLIDHPRFAAELVESTTLPLSDAESESSYLSDELLDAAVAMRLNVVLETRGQDTSLLVWQAERLKTADYRVIWIDVCASREECESGLAAQQTLWGEAVGLKPPLTPSNWGYSEQCHLDAVSALKVSDFVDEWHFIDRQGQPRPAVHQTIHEPEVREPVATETPFRPQSLSEVTISDGRRVRLGGFKAASPNHHPATSAKGVDTRAIQEPVLLATRGLRLGSFAAAAAEVTSAVVPAATSVAPLATESTRVIECRDFEHNTSLTAAAPTTELILCDGPNSVIKESPPEETSLDPAIERRRRLQGKLSRRADSNPVDRR